MKIAISVLLLLLSCRVVSWREIEQGTDWGVLLLFDGGLALSGVLGSSGASLFLARLCHLLFSSPNSPATPPAPLCLCLSSTPWPRSSNSPPPSSSSLSRWGLLPFMLPVGTPPNAIVFATGKVPQREMIRMGFALNLLFVALITALSLLIL